MPVKPKVKGIKPEMIKKRDSSVIMDLDAAVSVFINLYLF